MNDKEQTEQDLKEFDEVFSVNKIEKDKSRDKFIFQCNGDETLVIRLLGEAALIDIPIGTKFWGETDKGKKYEGIVIDFERYEEEKIYIRVLQDVKK